MVAPALPRVKLFQFREYVSGNGSAYFLAFFGESRLVMRRVDGAPKAGGEVARWDVFVEPAPVKSEPPRKGQPLTPLSAGRLG